MSRFTDFRCTRAAEPRRRRVNSAHDVGPTRMRMRVMSLACAVSRGYPPLTWGGKAKILIYARECIGMECAPYRRLLKRVNLFVVSCYTWARLQVTHPGHQSGGGWEIPSGICVPRLSTLNEFDRVVEKIKMVQFFWPHGVTWFIMPRPPRRGH